MHTTSAAQTSTQKSVKKSVKKSVAEEASSIKWKKHSQNIQHMLAPHMPPTNSTNSANSVNSSATTHTRSLRSHLEAIYRPGILAILSSSVPKTVAAYDILGIPFMVNARNAAAKVVHYNMQVGKIAQFALGNYGTFVNLPQGHASGLDIVCHHRKIAIELKNRDNTDNSSSRPTNLAKLHRFQEIHPDYLCLYGFINCKTEALMQKGRSGVYRCGDKEVPYLGGKKLLEFIMGDDVEEVIDFVKSVMEEYYTKQSVKYA